MHETLKEKRQGEITHCYCYTKNSEGLGSGVAPRPREKSQGPQDFPKIRRTGLGLAVGLRKTLDIRAGYFRLFLVFPGFYSS